MRIGANVQKRECSWTRLNGTEGLRSDTLSTPTPARLLHLRLRFRSEPATMRGFLTLALLLPFWCGGRCAEVKLVDVMTAGESSVDCKNPPCKYAAFRIPGLVDAGGNTLLAFAEGRKFGCGDFDGQHDLVTRKSTDGGLTWGPLHTIVDALHFWPTANASPPPSRWQ